MSSISHSPEHPASFAGVNLFLPWNLLAFWNFFFLCLPFLLLFSPLSSVTDNQFLCGIWPIQNMFSCYLLSSLGSSPHLSLSILHHRIVNDGKIYGFWNMLGIEILKSFCNEKSIDLNAYYEICVHVCVCASLPLIILDWQRVWEREFDKDIYRERVCTRARADADNEREVTTVRGKIITLQPSGSTCFFQSCRSNVCQVLRADRRWVESSRLICATGSGTLTSQITRKSVQERIKEMGNKKNTIQ